ncbi:MAG: hypothetical protein LBQ62_08075 [Candidatus Accumulibacter sp.]|jgi:hypothetical protein|nr:hypothetical protein [Accumulibacter sp.]
MGNEGKMKFIFAVFVFLPLFFSASCHASEKPITFDDYLCAERGGKEGECTMYSISLINLLATPERFHGKRVRLRAYVYADGERYLLYLLPGTSYPEAISLTFYSPGVWDEAKVDEYYRRSAEIQRKFHRRQVIVEGTYRMTTGGFSKGEIGDITRLDLHRHPIF